MSCETDESAPGFPDNGRTFTNIIPELLAWDKGERLGVREEGPVSKFSAHSVNDLEHWYTSVFYCLGKGIYPDPRGENRANEE